MTEIFPSEVLKYREKSANESQTNQLTHHSIFPRTRLRLDEGTSVSGLRLPSGTHSTLTT